MTAPRLVLGAALLVVGDRPTSRAWRVSLPASGAVAVTIAPGDADALAPWRFAVMGDIQDALPIVDEVFARINAEPGVRFVMSTGDIVHRDEIAEYELCERQLTGLDVPFYSTIGNHELWADPERWRERFDRYIVHFPLSRRHLLVRRLGERDDRSDRRRLARSPTPPAASTSLALTTRRWIRSASAMARSRAAAGVDLTLYGHLHTYVGFDNAGIDRHFLTVDVAPLRDEITAVTVVRVD